ncbi:hypothetical protein XENOCAPTIV_012923 [Xenoophorus captivus]|uniref:Uncharacterized protein n=1 Tax=Xenoophorus captivus TaxID=1517983 RepID=A0ABV0QVL0_9TELE
MFKQHHGVLSLDSYVAQEPEVPKKNARYSRCPLQQPNMPKQHQGCSLQVSKNPEQNSHSTKRSQHKRYLGKHRGEMIKLPQKTPHVAISRPSLSQKRHY